MRLKSFTIDDPLDLASRSAVEVTVTFDTGDRRWCFFFTPEGLSRCGDFLDGSDIRLHLGVPHMLVLTRVDGQIIERVLTTLDAKGELVEHTAPLQ
jgi:hypothetical protein